MPNQVGLNRKGSTVRREKVVSSEGKNPMTGLFQFDWKRKGVTFLERS